MRRAFTHAMRLALVGSLFALVAGGCTRRSLDYAGDGGPPDLAQADLAGSCASRSASDCAVDSRCIVIGCCGASECVPAGTPPPFCPACPRCDGLDEKSCIAHEASLGCTPFYCPDCHGGQSYVSCLGPNAGTGACGGGACPAGCRSASDCSGGQECVAPGASPGCGVCRPSDCTTDAQCASGQVCDQAPCVCTGSGRACIPACKSAADCGEGQSCTATHHCVPTPCSGASQCPMYFACVFTPGGGQCTRRTCASDAECGGGWCVDGACWGALGSCTFPPL